MFDLRLERVEIEPLGAIRPLQLIQAIDEGIAELGWRLAWPDWLAQASGPALQSIISPLSWIKWAFPSLAPDAPKPPATQ